MYVSAVLCLADEIGHGETRTFTEEELRKRLEVSDSCRLCASIGISIQGKGGLGFQEDCCSSGGGYGMHLAPASAAVPSNVAGCHTGHTRSTIKDFTAWNAWRQRAQ